MLRYRSLDWEVETTDRGRWVFRPRPHLMLAIVAACLLVALALLKVAGLADPAEAQLARAGAYLLECLAGLCALAGLYHQTRKVVVHPASGTLWLRNRVLEGGFRTELRELSLAGQTSISVWAIRPSGQEVMLIPGQLESARQTLAELAGELRAEEGESPPIERQFMTAFWLVFGLLWAGGGYLWAGNLWWDLGGGHGLLIWPFGLWLASLALLELVGVSTYSALARREAAAWWPLLWLASYFWFCAD
ncbi:MAG: hypothetical protein KC910_34655 [Candidatus Eremiobacteraeota bacterium]|nr:hypothetical protein [Candidatus Eremiobacteraeota bacterium]